VLRDDFISLLVRGCWMVSFFFTPIYMFILVFLVFFSTKKGTLLSYKVTWLPFFSQTLQILRSTTFFSRNALQLFIFKSTYRFQHTALTSRSTIYLLVLFWCFFFFFGESLLLAMLNYNTLIDLIPSGFFIFTKSHVLFMTFSFNSIISDILFYFILFFALTAIIFLLNLRYTSTYNYTINSTLLDLSGMLLISYIVSFWLMVAVFILGVWQLFSSKIFL
jgi:hypothetical protein